MEWQPSTPLSAEELARLPVFPLPRVVFFPGTALPLHLFEPRYTEMIEGCFVFRCSRDDGLRNARCREGSGAAA